MSRGGTGGTNWARRDGVETSPSWSTLPESHGVPATRGSDNKDIHYARRGFFTARNERPVCFAVSPCLFLVMSLLCVCVCVCPLSASAIRSSFRCASGIRDLRASTISPGKAIKMQSAKGTRSRKDNDGMEEDFTS